MTLDEIKKIVEYDDKDKIEAKKWHHEEEWEWRYKDAVDFYKNFDKYVAEELQRLKDDDLENGYQAESDDEYDDDIRDFIDENYYQNLDSFLYQYGLYYLEEDLYRTYREILELSKKAKTKEDFEKIRGLKTLAFLKNIFIDEHFEQLSYVKYEEWEDFSYQEVFDRFFSDKNIDGKFPPLNIKKEWDPEHYYQSLSNKKLFDLTDEELNKKLKENQIEKEKCEKFHWEWIDDPDERLSAKYHLESLENEYKDINQILRHRAKQKEEK